MKLGNSIKVSEELLDRVTVEEEHTLVKRQLVDNFASSLINLYEAEVRDTVETYIGARRFSLELNVYTNSQMKQIEKKLASALGNSNEAKNFLKEIDDKYHKRGYYSD